VSGRGRRPVPRVLAIAGSDPSGGAGIQADIKSISANGGYAMAAVTALTAQSTRGVHGVHVPPASFLRQQLDALGEDIRIDAVKIGMLADADIADETAGWLERTRPPVVVLDPVMVATSGDRLLDESAESALRRLLPLAGLITPNVPELAALVGAPCAANAGELHEQAGDLARDTGALVLAKGGHLGGVELCDALVDATAGVVAAFTHPRIVTSSTHGTGCSLSSAIATLRADRRTWGEATGEAIRWLAGAIARGGELGVGEGNGPVHHFADMWAGAGRR